jgi:hypothetical protein
MEHELRCYPEHYDAIDRGDKTCELRLNDRPYQVGDTLHLRRYEPLIPGYTGASLRVLVTHILSGGVWLNPGYIAMSIKLVDEGAVQRVHGLFMQKLAAEFPDHPWLKKEVV